MDDVIFYNTQMIHIIEENKFKICIPEIIYDYKKIYDYVYVENKETKYINYYKASSCILCKISHIIEDEYSYTEIIYDSDHIEVIDTKKYNIEKNKSNLNKFFNNDIVDEI